MSTANRSRLWLLGTLCLLLPINLTQAFNANTASGPHIEVSLLTETSSYKPGRTLWLGVLFEPETDWHTYWLNPGDSGEPPRIELKLPKGVEAGAWHWEIPKVIPVAHLVNYGYSRSMLMTPISVAEDYVGELSIDALLTWLVCKEDCIPGEARLTLNLNETAGEASLNAQAHEFERSRERHYVPRVFDVRFEINEQSICLQLPQSIGSDWTLLPFENDWIDHASDPVAVTNSRHTLVSFSRSASFWATPSEMQWLAINPDGTAGYVFTATSTTSTQSNSHSWLWFLLLAFAGGLILNIMPCVLPVLAIKALSLSQDSNQRAHGHAYLFGVVLSFMAFAVVIEATKASGEHLGWGFQMQSPSFVAILALLFFSIGLWMLDALKLGHKLQQVGASVPIQQGNLGSFITGCLAVLVATPCTAPFMAAALGFGLQANEVQNFAIFLALALGFGAPLWLLHLLPSLKRVIPRPGVWMLYTKQLLAFPLFATSIWLCWVLNNLAHGNAVVLSLCGALLIALASHFIGRKSTFVHVSGLLLLLSAYVFTPSWVSTQDNSEVATQSLSSNNINQKIADAQRAGLNVLVNVTADWCITCKVNEQVAFKSLAVQARLAEPDLRYIEIDWTRKNPEIFDYLQSFDRSGVPLYVFYPLAGEPVLLPQILTPDTLLTYLSGDAP